jgi:hypothetical protein
MRPDEPAMSTRAAWGGQVRQAGGSRIGEIREYEFRHHHEGDPRVPLIQITPDDGHYVHTYYDVCPFSPSQRYLAATRLPYHHRLEQYGDRAEACVIDLEAHTITTVYATLCWGFQVGASLHWGATDRYLYTNDVVDGQAVCVRIDLETGATRSFRGPMGHIAPDESCVIGFPLELRNVTQLGYGMPSRDPTAHPRLPPGAAADEGIWRTDLRTDEKRLLASVAAVAAHVPESPPEPGGTYYFWHTKFNPQGDRIIAVLRYVAPRHQGRRNPMVFTMDAEGGDIHYTPAHSVWGTFGGHPCWAPDGRSLIKNVGPGAGMRFVRTRYDGTETQVLSETIPGGGHPSIEPRGRYVITDAFREDVLGRKWVQLRLIDLQRQDAQVLCTVPTITTRPRWRRLLALGSRNPNLRLDGHPVWSRDYRKICLQAAPRGRRQLLIADLSGMAG